MNTLTFQRVAILATLVLYLVVEVMFNTHLIDTVNELNYTAEDINRLELVGRSISSIGLCLIFSNLLRRKIGKLTIVALPLLLCGAFTGQKLLLDKVVDSASSEMRKNAFVATVQAQAITLTDYEKVVRTDTLSTQALLPALIYAQVPGYQLPTLKEDLVCRPSMVNELAQSLLGEQELLTRYASFKAERDQFLDLYSQYKAINRASFSEVNQAAASAWDKALELFTNETRIKKALYSEAKAVFSEKGKRFSQRLRSFQQENCQSNPRCIKVAKDIYNKMVRGTKLYGTSLTQWLPESGRVPKYELQPDYYHQRFVVIAFKQISGFEVLPKERYDYIRSEVFQSRLKSQLGLNLNAQIHTENDLASALLAKRVNDPSLLLAYRLSRIEAGLSLHDFYDNEVVKDAIFEFHGKEMNSDFLTVDSFDSFKRMATPKALEEIRQGIITGLNADVGSFEKHSKFYTQGENALRAIYAITFALCMSYLCISMMLVRLSRLLFELVTKQGTTWQITAPLTALLFVLPAFISLGSAEGVIVAWLTDVHGVIYMVGKDIELVWEMS